MNIRPGDKQIFMMILSLLLILLQFLFLYNLICFFFFFFFFKGSKYLCIVQSNRTKCW